MSLPVIRRDLELPANKHDTNEGKLAFVLENVMSSEECQRFIDITEKKGYEAALLNVGGGREILATDVRNSHRCIWDSETEAKIIWERVKPYVPEVFRGKKVIGLNERLRFLRYDPGEYFKPHMDGSYIRENGEKSLLTLQLYLNEGFKGGETTFLSYNEAIRCPLVPKTGSVLIFQHDLYHEGSELKEGRKYSMRTDIMYESSRKEVNGNSHNHCATCH